MNVTGTYRLQLNADFGFADAEAVVPYLAALGVSHLYLSPVLQAAQGSMHGYDVVDHSRVNAELGGREALESLAAAAHERGLGVIVDVVPNHMAFVAPESANKPLWEVLRDGRDAPTAEWFDIDWRVGGGRLGLPILGDDLPAVLQAQEITLDRVELPCTDSRAEWVIRYFDHVLPIALGTEGEAWPGCADPEIVGAVLDRQHYRLASWRDKDSVLNYRRFFEVDGLIAVRVEIKEVFDATHALLLELHKAGVIDGFRIDHPDGLADPEQYLNNLAAATKRGTPIFVEKIIEGSEVLPEKWKCAGTTGYDGLRVVQAALVDTAAEAVITQQWRASGGDEDLAGASEAAKRQVVAQSLGPELERLTRRAREVLPERDPERLREAIAELLVSGEVYRAYLRADEKLSPDARRRLTEAFSAARANRPDLDDELVALVPLAVPDDESTAPAIDFSVRLQQTWGPVMAKGIEDTLFYRNHRLVALNEVGGDPDDLEHGSVQKLHIWAQHQVLNWPGGMTTLSTHDTKRSEDVRARILAIAGDTQGWEELSRLSRECAQEMGVDMPTAHLVWQTLVGVGDIDHERIQAYLQKAVREAKVHTSWVDGDEEYERRIVEFADKVRSGGALHEAIERIVEKNAQAIRAHVLGAKTLQLTMPGVPDVYQGCEVVNLSLVDPDNRRPVDYARRLGLLEALNRLGLGETPSLDEEKLHVTSRILKLRKDAPALFNGSSSYTPLTTNSEFVVGFERSTTAGRIAAAFGWAKSRNLVTIVSRAPQRLEAAGGFGESTVTLPEGTWHDVLTDDITYEGGHVRLADLLHRLPVAVLAQ
ncbi:Maltooligosyl trehalose synthase [Dermatophilus congolensis]|uniref:Maltooligosyl trehalose synthase n=1 Tax=Dermatophilus congolensis TaxID=1863 RepID=A0AA46BLI1_9MICO|nr:malto-oligosyltrehalose synthase [Dermatophilus congolensis]STD04243.1 Maltooligosyl trehalose synthase [Dermatophilus congolensis]